VKLSIAWGAPKYSACHFGPIAANGKGHAEARSMIAGAAGFLENAASASWPIMRYKMPAFLAPTIVIPVWSLVAFGSW
jgi:hypothetical protein